MTMARGKAIKCGVKSGGKLVFPGKYITAHDLTDEAGKPRDVNLTIERAYMAELERQDGDSETKLLVKFTGAKKAMVLNKTNAATIAAIHGNNADEWGGKRITLYPTKTQAFGALEPCIRVREKAPADAGAKAPAAPAPVPDSFNTEEITNLMES